MPDPGHPLEALLAEALACLDSGGPAALAHFLAAHPAEAPALREALGDLHSLDLLTAKPTDLRQLGEFRILGRLGEGGMGVVYLAEQSSLGREVALKVVRPELLLFEGARERFRREIDAVARLEHAAIVPILATGTDDGVPWYAMPRLRGCSGEAVVKALAARAPRELTGADLHALLQPVVADGTDSESLWRGPWWQVVARLVQKAALGIQHAHARGVLHRDLKPSNLMLTADGRAVVLDFGLAQARGDEHLTRTGSAAGSPAYMAPEQLRGEGADERTDVYGLGATLHCLLALRAPFAQTDAEALRARILAGERHPLRDRSEAPPELLLVVDTAMDVERARRYGSAQAFADDLQAVLDGRPIAARRLPWHVHCRRFAQRHRGLAAAAAATVVFLLALPPLLLWQQHRANDDLAAEVARTDAANRALAAQVARADHGMNVTIDAVDSLLGSVALPKLRNLPAVQSVAADLLDDALALFDRLADDQAQAHRVQHLRRRTLLDAAQLATTLARNDKATALIDRLLRLLGNGPVRDDEEVQRARARGLLAWIHYRAGRATAAAELLAQNRVALTRLAAGPAGAPATVAAARELSETADLECGLAVERGDRPAALRASRERVATLETLLGAEAVDVELFNARISLGANLRDAGLPGEARPLLESTIADLTAHKLPERGWPVPRVLLAMAQHELASLEVDLEQPAAAEPWLRSSLQLFDDLVRDYPDGHALRRHRGRTANLLASICNGAEDWAEARALLEQALRDQERVLQHDPGDRAAVRYLAQHRRTLLVCLRGQQDWPALEDAARALGQLGGGDENTGRAARDLLRCASFADPIRQRWLHDEALALMAQAADHGMRPNPADPLYGPVRDDLRFRAFLSRRRR